MDLSVTLSKLFLLAIIIFDMIYFSIVQYKHEKKTILMITMLFLLGMGTLLDLLIPYSDSYVLTVMRYLIGFTLVGFTALFIALSSHLRMNRVIKHDAKLSHRT